MRSILLILVSLGMMPCAWPVVEVHVARNGDDRQQGTADHPLATVHRAQRIVRDHEALGHRSVDVRIHPGTYELVTPLALTPEGSGRHVHFNGLAFRHTSFTLGHIEPRVRTDAALRFENTQDSPVTNCRFENLGGYAFWLQLDSQRNTFDRNTVLDSGGGDVLLTGARLSYTEDSKVFTLGEPGNLIAHNHFEDLSRNGIFEFRNQGGNVVEYNHIHNAMQTTIDGACIHFAAIHHLNAPNFILNNWLNDIWGLRHLPDQKPKRVLANGVSLAWDTSNTIVRNNFVYISGGESIKALWNNQNITISDNTSSRERIVPPFVEDLGPDGTVTHGIDLASNRLVGGMVHYFDAAHVRREGTWRTERAGGQWKHIHYSLLVAEPGEPVTITYSLPITKGGKSQVSLLYKPESGNATNLPVEVEHSRDTSTFAWDMTKGSKHGFSVEVGRFDFEFGKPARVTLTNHDADGIVADHSIAFVKLPSGICNPDSPIQSNHQNI